MSMFWWLSTRRIVRRRSVHIRVNNDTVCRFVDEERIEPVYPEDRENQCPNAGIKIVSEVLPGSSSQHSLKPIIASTAVAQLPKRTEQVVLLIFPKKIREYLVGDLAEEYTQIALKHGAKFANIWYWKQVAASTWPFLKRALTWGLLASTWEWVRRII